MKKILITGCAGFIGFHLSQKLSLNNIIYGLDNISDYYDQNLKLQRLNLLSKNINFIKLDLTNKKKLKQYLQKYEFDLIIHLAAQAGVRYSFSNPNEYIESNIIGTYNLIEAVKNQKNSHLIFASTSSVYGTNLGKIPSKETDSTDRPLSLYSSSKKACEILLYNYSLNFNIPITVLRFFTVYGPWGRPDMALFKFLELMNKNKPIEVYNSGELWRDFTYIDDLVKAVDIFTNIAPSEKNRVKEDSLCTSAPYRIVNIGNQKSIKLKQVIKILEKVTNQKFTINNLPMQPGDVPYTLSNSSLLKRLTGFSPTTDIETGIINFYNWYLNYLKV